MYCSFLLEEGSFGENGAIPTEDGICFTIRSSFSGCRLHLFINGEETVLRLPEKCHKNGIYSAFLRGLPSKGLSYAYSFDGPYEGSLMLDPYAREVIHIPDKKMAYLGTIPDMDFDWQGIQNPCTKPEDMVIYETHVRGMTMGEDSGVQHPGTYLGMAEKIPYLQELGINTLELMPVFEFDEMDAAREYNGEQLVNYWGYSTVSFFAPNRKYSATGSPCMEFKTLVRELHRAGISVILDVVFNHTAEGNGDGPAFSLKGIAGREAYLMTPDGYYYNFSGCGNTTNCNGRWMKQFILDCLHYWVKEYHVDGFRFDLASILTRGEDGAPLADPPIIREIAKDPQLADTILIAEAWDAGGLYQVGSFPHYGRWMEWNGRYRDDLRKFLKGDPGICHAAENRIIGSPDIYTSGQPSCVNFITCHDGFTMYDLYAYNWKHNDGNGWGNMDGNDSNNSWNCGQEGMAYKEVEDLRKRMIKNAFAALFMSRGPIMFNAGDEFCNTQYGNNNAYCQDNRIGWLEWNRMEEYEEIHGFVRHMARLRAKHPSIRNNDMQASYKFPCISVHNGNQWDTPDSPHSMILGIMYAGKSDTGKDDAVLYLMNAYWYTQKILLPEPPHGLQWRVDTCTYLKYQEGMDVGREIAYNGGKNLFVPERSTVILTAL